MNEASNNIDGAFNTNTLSNELQESSEKITDMKDSEGIIILNTLNGLFILTGKN